MTLELEDFKFRVHNEEESAVVQEVLFSFGYKWDVRGKQVQYLDGKYLYVYANGRITYGTSDGNFVLKNHKEIIIK